MAVPGSKSDTIRAVLLSMLSEGRSVIHNPLASGDGLSAKEAAIALGASITEAGDRWIVEGVGRHLEAPQKSLDLGNSGTATSFFIDRVVGPKTGHAYRRRADPKAALQDAVRCP